MSDIAELLRGAALPPGALDLERVHREGRHRQQRPKKVAGALVAAAAVVAASLFISTRNDHQSAPVIAPPTTEPHITVAPTVPPTITPATTSVPTITLPPGTDQLTAESRLGYAGLGPIKLGMTFAEAESAGRVTITPGTCPYVLRPGPDSALAPIVGRSGATITGLNVWREFPFEQPDTISEIEVGHPAIYTISGVHVGSTYDEVRGTYPSAVETVFAPTLVHLTITNPEGRTIKFLIGPDRTVVSMSLGLTPTTNENNSKC